ncbi:MAG: hypothetical protein H8E37_05975 [Planctomycetes bacterium]|nr:hypothetical protein [Planctomycetota bacterium]
MKKFSAMLAICGLFLVTGCQEDQPEGAVRSSTRLVNVEDFECCCAPAEEYDEPTPEPVETPYSEPGPIASTDDGWPDIEI